MRRAIREHTEHLQDLVEQKTQELLAAERLATIGQTVAGLSHSIKNMASGLEGSLFAQVQHTLEPFGPAIIRIGDFVRAGLLRKIHEQTDFRVALRWTHAPHELEILTVHGQNPVKAEKILNFQASRTQP